MTGMSGRNRRRLSPAAPLRRIRQRADPASLSPVCSLDDDGPTGSQIASNNVIADPLTATPAIGFLAAASQTCSGSAAQHAAAAAAQASQVPNVMRQGPSRFSQQFEARRAAMQPIGSLSEASDSDAAAPALLPTPGSQESPAAAATQQAAQDGAAPISSGAMPAERMLSGGAAGPSAGIASGVSAARQLPTTSAAAATADALPAADADSSPVSGRAASPEEDETLIIGYAPTQAVPPPPPQQPQPSRSQPVVQRAASDAHIHRAELAHAMQQARSAAGAASDSPRHPPRRNLSFAPSRSLSTSSADSGSQGSDGRLRAQLPPLQFQLASQYIGERGTGMAAAGASPARMAQADEIACFEAALRHAAVRDEGVYTQQLLEEGYAEVLADEEEALLEAQAEADLEGAAEAEEALLEAVAEADMELEEDEEPADAAGQPPEAAEHSQPGGTNGQAAAAAMPWSPPMTPGDTTQDAAAARASQAAVSSAAAVVQHAAALAASRRRAATAEEEAILQDLENVEAEAVADEVRVVGWQADLNVERWEAEMRLREAVEDWHRGPEARVPVEAAAARHCSMLRLGADMLEISGSGALLASEPVLQDLEAAAQALTDACSARRALLLQQERQAAADAEVAAMWAEEAAETYRNALHDLDRRHELERQRCARLAAHNRALEQQLQDYEEQAEDTRCTICYAAPRTVQLLPCLHCFCARCVRHHQEMSPAPGACPLCRTAIRGTLEDRTTGRAMAPMPPQLPRAA